MEGIVTRATVSVLDMVAKAEKRKGSGLGRRKSRDPAASEALAA